MKCDELIPTEIYARFAEEVYDDFGDSSQEQEYYRKEHADAAITELKNEIKRKEGVGKRWFERCMEARAENVRLKRALWLARAELCHRLDVDRYLRNHRNSWYNENCLTWADACVAMEVKMCKAESKCRAKAEEYK